MEIKIKLKNNDLLYRLINFMETNNIKNHEFTIKIIGEETPINNEYIFEFKKK